MKKLMIAIAMIILIIIPSLEAKVVIQEVLYDPINNENGGEAVLLYNKGDKTINASGWFIATKTSQKDATLPPETLILPGGYLLIADNEFSLNKDNSSWPDAHYEEAINLANTNAGVALMNETEIVDAVGWGDPLLIGEQFYKGTPTTMVSEGESIRRIQDTNNNSADFIGGTPIFFREETSSQENSDENNEGNNETSQTNENNETNESNNEDLELTINIEINITNNNPKILSLKILTDDNSTKEGIQINPEAGSTKKIEIEVEAYDIDGSEELEKAKIVLENKEFTLEKTEINETNVLFKGNISMEYYEEAKNYSITAVVESKGEEFSKETTFEYQELKAISTEENLGFELPAGNQSMKTITIKNLGNKDIELKVKGTNIANSFGSINIESITWSSDEYTTSKAITTNYENLGTLTRGENLNISFKVNAEENLKSGRYIGQIKISG